MPLAFSIEELFTSQVEARLHVETGAITFNFTPSRPRAPMPGTLPTGIRVHFETRVDANGVNVLSISASAEDRERPVAYSCDVPVLDSTQEQLNPSVDSACVIIPTISLPDHLAAFADCFYSESFESNGRPALDWTAEMPNLPNAHNHIDQSIFHDATSREDHEGRAYIGHELPTVVAGGSPPSSASASPSPSLSASDSSEGPMAVKPRIPCLHADCGRRFKNEYTRSIHMRAHIFRNSRFPCRHCPVILSRRHDRMRHEIAQHNVVPPFTCKECSKSFGSERNMALHQCADSSKRIVWSAQYSP